MEPVHAEQIFCVRPRRSGAEACLHRQIAEAIDGVFVRVFGMNGFAFAKAEALSQHRHRLIALADQMHFNALQHRIVEGVVAETGRIKCRAQFQIGSPQHIQVKRRRHALRVVVRRMQSCRLLDQIYTNQ